MTISDDTTISTASDLTVGGNLIVSGSTTTVNTATMTVEDHNIVLGSGNGTGEVVDGAGLTLEGGSGDDITFQYNTTDNRMELKHGSSFEDFKAGTITGTLSGNASTATALATARDIHGVSFDGSANIDLTEVIQDTVGAMFTGNTETNITATYEDGDGTIDLVVAGSTVGDGLTLANGADNRVVTATGSAALNGEANLTFDGSDLKIDTGASGSENDAVILLDGYSTSDSNRVAQPFVALNDGDSVANMTVVRDGANDAAAITLGTQPTSGNITERMRITSAGKVGVGVTNPYANLTVNENFLVSNSGDTADPKIEGMLFRHTGTTNNNPNMEMFFVENEGLNYGFRMHYDGSNNRMRFYTHDNDTNGSEVMRFNRAAAGDIWLGPKHGLAVCTYQRFALSGGFHIFVDTSVNAKI